MANTRILFCFFLIVFSTIKCDVESDCYGGVPSEKHECFNRIDEDYKEQGWHCCFITLKKEDTKTIYHECDLLESDEYDDIGDYKEKNYLEDIECHQSYLKLNKFKYMEFALMNLFLLLIIM